MGGPYIQRVAKTMIGQLGINFADYDYLPIKQVGVGIFRNTKEEIEAKLKKMSLATRAKIAAQGKAQHTPGGWSLEDVHVRSTWVDGSLSGEDIILLTATTAIIAAICEFIVWDRVNRGVGRELPGPGDRMRVGEHAGLATPSFMPNLDAYDRMN